MIVMTIFVVAIGSLGIAGIPGTATMAASVGLSGVGMGAQFGMVSPILAIDPIIDMPRTMINVTGSLTNALVVDKMMGNLNLDDYNDMCDEGYDSQFHKKHEYLHPITGKGGYLVGKYYIAAYGTVGGVRINKYGEVMDANLKPIPGLYSAGSDANTIYGDSYNFTLCGNTMGFAINSGRMAGEAIADYIDDNF